MFDSVWVIFESGRIGSGQPLLGLENPLKNPNFHFFPCGNQKKSLGRVKKYPCQRYVGFLFIAGQKYAWVGPEQSPLLPSEL